MLVNILCTPTQVFGVNRIPMGSRELTSVEITSSKRDKQQVNYLPSRLIKKMLNPQNHLRKFRNRSLINLKLSDWTIKSKLQALLLLVSLGSVMVVSGIGWYQTQATLRNKIAEQLEGISNTKAEQFESYFENLNSQVGMLAADGNIVKAMVELNAGYRILESNFIPPEWDKALDAYYNEKFFPQLQKNLYPEVLNPSVYIPTAQAARYLQYYYIASNPNTLGKKDKLLDAGDGSDYTKAHAKYQKIFAGIVQKFGYYDVFLINHKTGDIVYSYFKETDFATTRLQGFYSQSSLTSLVQAVQTNPTQGSIQVADFKPYRPSYNAPAAFIATPIYSGSNMIGILAVQIPIEKMDKAISRNNNWEGSGLQKTGEAYLVGPDFLMRSTSRFWVEDPKKYQNVVRNMGTDKRTLELMENFNTTIALQKINSPAAKAALEGQQGMMVNRNYRGVEVLSSYAPLQLNGLNWAILAEIEVGEAYRPLYNLQVILLIAAALFLLGTAFLAEVAARIFTSPLRRLTENARKLVAGELDGEVEVKSQDEFGELATEFKQVANKLRQTEEDLEINKQENDILLHNILPRAIADRRKQGELLIADSLKQVTILNAHLAGVAELSKQMSPTEVTELLTRLFDEFDKAAEHFGVERQNTITTDYVAVCGLTQARFDHSKRTVDFALAMLDIIQRRENGRRNFALGLRIGIHAGPIAAGVVGTEKFSYSIWGETVYLASRLQSQTELNYILLTQSVYERVADSFTFVQNPSVNIENLGNVQTWTLVTAKKLVTSQVDLVQSSFAKVKPIADKAAELFYNRLFELEPSFRPLFKGDMKEQERKLMATLALCVEGLRHPNKIIPVVQKLGRDHAGFGVKAEYYDIVGEALLWTLAQGLGEEFTTPVRKAWEEAYAFLSEIMKEAAAELELEKIGV
ncbi:adenylate/guanylate cyclase domain-containing protein [Argonema antarcticum]|uniref:adenylate/guanylate cyclase domain-containing protein n=1 Tax=Argonema antarcticum TaxID=2942763 RepID=UPI0020113EB8|nr:adenylate/guanylate cyclase domain-containing protein [Argonema antarcticum]MCL1469982.1 HAMP domain-containing protein [Argonema antarcticum A004/B2]